MLDDSWLTSFLLDKVKLQDYCEWRRGKEAAVDYYKQMRHHVTVSTEGCHEKSIRMPNIRAKSEDVRMLEVTYLQFSQKLQNKYKYIAK
jgi:hypothetical protein